MAALLNILVVRRWTLDRERIRTSLCASGLTVRLVNVDFAAALVAALCHESFDVVIYDPETPGLSEETLSACMREQNIVIPVVVLRDVDVIGQAVVRELQMLRN